jgi:hypothetical protein
MILNSTGRKDMKITPLAFIVTIEKQSKIRNKNYLKNERTILHRAER